MADLKSAIVRVIRTSTSEVNRRKGPRQAVDLSCRLRLADAADDVRLADLSPGGARLTDAPDLQVGARGNISLAGMPVPAGFVVRAVDPQGAVHVAFEQSEAVHSAVAALLAASGEQRAA